MKIYKIKKIWEKEKEPYLIDIFPEDEFFTRNLSESIHTRG